MILRLEKNQRYLNKLKKLYLGISLDLLVQREQPDYQKTQYGGITNYGKQDSIEVLLFM